MMESARERTPIAFRWPLDEMSGIQEQERSEEKAEDGVCGMARHIRHLQDADPLQFHVALPGRNTNGERYDKRHEDGEDKKPQVSFHKEVSFPIEFWLYPNLSPW